MSRLRIVYTPILLVLFVFSQSFGQNDCKRIIKGQVLDRDTNKPLPYATVKILNTEIGAICEEDGSFKLTDICDMEVDFEVRFVGYKTVVHHHDFRSKRNKDQIDDGHIIYLAPNENILRSVVIEGEATVGDFESISIEKLDGSKLTTKTTQSLAAAVGEIQGVTFTSFGSNVQLPIIHGLYGNRILVINNGVKHGFQNWGNKHAPEIDISSANNISVLKGAAGVRFGPEALGGVVVVEGDPLRLTQKMYGGISAGYQTNGRGYQANGYLGAGNSKFSYHLGGNYRRLGDRSTPNYLLYNTGMEEYSANIGLRYHLPNWDFKGYYSYVDQDLGILRPSVARSIDLFAEIVAASEPILMRPFSYEIGEPNQQTAHHLGNLEIDWHSNSGKFTFLLSQQINNRREFEVRRNAERPIIDLTLRTTDSRLEWRHPSVGRMQGMVGLQYFSQNNDNNPGTGSIPFIPNYNSYRFSAFLVEHFQKGRNLFELGMRLDHELNSVRGREQNQDLFSDEFSFTNVTASLGLVRDLSANWQMRTNLGTGWRPPNMAELYSFGQHGFQIIYGLWRYYTDENGDLRTDRVLTQAEKEVNAEKSIKWTNEFRHQKERNTLILTGYVNYIDNFIFIRPAGLGSFFWGPGPIYIYDQANALFIGAEFTYSRILANNLKGTLGASYLWSRNVERDEPLINQPPININAEISWNTPLFFGFDYSRLTFQAAYTFKQFQAPRTITPEQLINGEEEINLESEIFDFKDAPDGYFLGNLLWEWRSSKFGGQLELRNMFNTVYRDYLNQMRLFADDLGINFIVTVNYNF